MWCAETAAGRVPVQHPTNMSPDQTRRKQAFDALFNSIPIDPAKPRPNQQRVARVCDVLFCKPGTVHGWRMAKPHRVITDAKIKILERALAG